MPSRRVEKAAEAIREIVSMAILTELQDPRVRDVTVTYVEVSPDLRHAKVHVSVMGDETQQNLTPPRPAERGRLLAGEDRQGHRNPLHAEVELLAGSRGQAFHRRGPDPATSPSPEETESRRSDRRTTGAIAEDDRSRRSGRNLQSSSEPSP